MFQPRNFLGIGVSQLCKHNMTKIWRGMWLRHGHFFHSNTVTQCKDQFQSMPQSSSSEHSQRICSISCLEQRINSSLLLHSATTLTTHISILQHKHTGFAIDKMSNYLTYTLYLRSLATFWWAWDTEPHSIYRCSQGQKLLIFTKLLFFFFLLEILIYQYLLGHTRWKCNTLFHCCS